MQDALHAYFEGEKAAGLFLAGLGAVGLVATFLLFRHQRALALTLGFFAVAGIAIGIGLYLRTDPQVAKLVAQLTSDPARFTTEEGARMAKVQRNFVVIEYVEIALLFVGGIAAIVMKAKPTASGIALGLVVAAGIFLTFDVIAERRGASYVTAIRNLE